MANKKWKFEEFADGLILRCPCGAEITTDEMKKDHAPHLNGVPTSWQKKLQEWLRKGQINLSGKNDYSILDYTHLMSGKKYTQGELFGELIVVSCWPSKRVKNNYEILTVPLLHRETRGAWQLAYWNYWRNEGKN